MVYLASLPVKCLLHCRGEAGTYISQNAFPQVVPGLSGPGEMLPGDLESDEEGKAIILQKEVQADAYTRAQAASA